MLEQDVFLEQALIDEQVLTRQQVADARRLAAEQKTDFVDALVGAELIDHRRLAMLRASICEAPFVDLAHYEPCLANTSLLPRSIAERHLVFPLFSVDGVLTLAMDDPLNLEAADQARQAARCEVDAVQCDREQLRSVIGRAYSLSQHRPDDSAETIPEVDADLADDAQPVVAAVNQLMSDAIEQRASDIHLNPDEHALHLRYRIDGVLHERQGPSLSMHAGLVQRLKVMAQLDLTQTRRPQDGKFRFRCGGGHVDVRMSTVPTVNGENVVLRLLARTEAIGDFLELGVPASMSQQIDELLSQPYGMMLVTGPTGSGKTTSLYTALSKLNDPSRNIMTVEDPVEIRLPYVRQIQAHAEIGLTFANALRSILRQDPDVVLVGEIRDEETACIALQAALTGHLVLSTVHTNDSVGAVARLRDFGLPPFVINSALLGVMAQRLVRRVCGQCARPDTPSDLMRRRFRLSADSSGFTSGAGCPRCGQTGYKGRIGVYELFKFTSDIQRLCEQGASTDELRRAMARAGMRFMWQDGLDKARMGQTTLDEIARAATVIEVEPSTDTETGDERLAA